MKTWILPALGVLALAACSKEEPPPAPKPAAAPVTSAAPAAPQRAPNTGKVLSMQQAGPYTYIEVDHPSGQKVWMAGGHIEVKPGDMIQWGDFVVMTNFIAKSLGRTFEQILFVGNWGPAGGSLTPVAPHGAPAAAGGQTGMAGHPPLPGQAAGAGTGGGASSGKVKSVAVAGGYTYLEIDRAGQMVWVAVPETPVAVGADVTWDGGMVMKNFNAKSLNRVFDSIVFAGSVSVAR